MHSSQVFLLTGVLSDTHTHIHAPSSVKKQSEICGTACDLTDCALPLCPQLLLLLSPPCCCPLCFWFYQCATAGRLTQQTFSVSCYIQRELMPVGHHKNIKTIFSDLALKYSFIKISITTQKGHKKDKKNKNLMLSFNSKIEKPEACRSKVGHISYSQC